MKADKKEKREQYYVFMVEPCENSDGLSFERVKRIPLTYFYADDDKDAYEKYKEFVRVANKQHKYYYSEAHKNICMGEDGKTEHSFNTTDEMFAYFEEKRSKSPWKRFCSWLRVKKMSFDEMMWNRKNVRYFKENGHSLSEKWDLFSHIIDDIEFNVPKLKEETTVPQYYEVLAWKKLNGDDSKTEFFNSFSRRVYDGDEKEYKVAKELWNKDLDAFLEDVRLYRYYRDYGIVDKNDENYVKIHEKYRNTLPYRPGRYREFDYKKLEAMRIKQKNKVMEFLRKYGETLGD